MKIKKRPLKIVLFILLGLAVLSGIFYYVSQNATDFFASTESVDVNVFPATQTKNVNEEFNVSFTLSGKRVDGADIYVTYDNRFQYLKEYNPTGTGFSQTSNYFDTPLIENVSMVTDRKKVRVVVTSQKTLPNNTVQFALKFRGISGGSGSIQLDTTNTKLSGVDSSQSAVYFTIKPQNLVANVTINATGATPAPTGAQTNPGIPIGDEARYKEANGPCVGKAGTSCVFETRTFFIDATGKQLEESITAYGKYYNYNLTTKKWTQANLTTIARYTASNGPCAGKTGTSCIFDTRSFWISDGIVVETITAYGKYFNYRAPNWTALSGSGSDLTTVARYIASNGPCAGRTTGQCKFDSRDFFIDGNGKQLEESITAYGKYYNYKLPEFTLTTSGTLNSIPRYAGGPCYGKAAGQCVFQTRAFWLDPQGVIESITANGRYYNYTRDGKNWPTTPPTATPTARPTTVVPTATRTPTPAQTNPGKPIGDEARYKEANGPCVGRSGTSCVFETRTFFIDATGKQLEESITAYGKYYNYNLTTKKWTQANLTTVSRYTASNGPCAGKSGTTCVFDTRSFWISDGIVVETITAYGKYFNYRAPNWTALSGSGSDLTTVARYIASNGPCAGRTTGQCKFDSRDFYIDGTGKQLEESIMAYGRYYNYKLPEFTLTGSGTLESIARYAGGPCYGKAAGQCVFQTRAFWLDPQGVIESITANGRYYNYTMDGRPWLPMPTATIAPPTATRVPPTSTVAPTARPTTAPTVRPSTPVTATTVPNPSVTMPGGCAKLTSGDANCDGIIDYVDFVCWREELNRSKPTNCRTADFDRSGVVNAADYARWRDTFIPKN